mmetsp:Transcript_6515/g.23935  ORF Transcript_6515/g.23935 Transcript_6515/m.23935 type:complete len:216 (-) Transcript_6515:1108-1755(-)
MNHGLRPASHHSRNLRADVSGGATSLTFSRMYRRASSYLSRRFRAPPVFGFAAFGSCSPASSTIDARSCIRSAHRMSCRPCAMSCSFVGMMRAPSCSAGTSCARAKSRNAAAATATSVNSAARLFRRPNRRATRTNPPCHFTPCTRSSLPAPVSVAAVGNRPGGTSSSSPASSRNSSISRRSVANCSKCLFSLVRFCIHPSLPATSLYPPCSKMA